MTVSLPAETVKKVDLANRREHRTRSGLVREALRDMQTDPFFGDIKWLKNQPHTLRRRVGVWRILFDLEREPKIILIGDVVR